MTCTELYDDTTTRWTKILAPSNPLETHLVRVIARHDVLMELSFERAMKINRQPEYSNETGVQRDLAATMDSLVHIFTTLRLRPRPEPPTPSIGAVGRPRKIQMEPAIPIDQSRRLKERGTAPTLDWTWAA